MKSSAIRLPLFHCNELQERSLVVLFHFRHIFTSINYPILLVLQVLISCLLILRTYCTYNGTSWGWQGWRVTRSLKNKFLTVVRVGLKVRVAIRPIKRKSYSQIRLLSLQYSQNWTPLRKVLFLRFSTLTNIHNKCLWMRELSFSWVVTNSFAYLQSISTVPADRSLLDGDGAYLGFIFKTEATAIASEKS